MECRPDVAVNFSTNPQMEVVDVRIDTFGRPKNLREFLDSCPDFLNLSFGERGSLPATEAATAINRMTRSARIFAAL